MLRLQPSEIAITPDDSRVVNEQLDMRKRARGRGKLHPGPERSRADAITSLHDRGILPYRAEEVSGEHEATDQTRSAQARARLGLSLASSQPRAPAELPSAGIHFARPVQLEASDSSSTSHTAPVPLQAQLDGQVNAATSPA